MPDLKDYSHAFSKLHVNRVQGSTSPRPRKPDMLPAVCCLVELVRLFDFFSDSEF
jgi:hypothetical protein